MRSGGLGFASCGCCLSLNWGWWFLGEVRVLTLARLTECGANRCGTFPLKPVFILGAVRSPVFAGRVNFNPNGLVATGATLACLALAAVAGLIALRQDIALLNVCWCYRLGALMLGRRNMIL